MSSGTPPLSLLLLLLCASYGMTQTTSSVSLGTEGYNCKPREGISLTVMMDAYMVYWSWDYYLAKALSPLSGRFPCVTRQYASIILDYSDTNVTTTNDKSYFSESVSRSYLDGNIFTYYKHFIKCNQSLLHGLKKALEISPDESVILVFTAGSMVDYNDTQLLTDIYALLETTRSQVYFLWVSWWNCKISASQQEIFDKIASLSLGEVIDMGYVSYYTLMHSIELQLAKPLNSSVPILNINPHVPDRFHESFNITDDLNHLLITKTELFAFNITSPDGNTWSSKKHPYYMYYYFDKNLQFISSSLVQSPDEGTWTLNAQGNGSLAVQILGFPGLNISESCFDSDCHPNATCLEFGGYGECTCKEGFTGDGKSCIDIDECNEYSSNCYYYGGGYCVNTIGSYVCDCYDGFQYIPDHGCVEIDECADSSLNDCHPLATCTNYYGYYTCTCPKGYFGDGKHCEINECLQGSPCNAGDDCFKYIGSYSCVDPCSNHTVLSDPWRSPSNTYSSNWNKYYNWYHCDYGMTGWHRFKGEHDLQIPEYCVPKSSCGTYIPIWMNGSHPTLNDGVVTRKACPNWYKGCCTNPFNISVKKCPGGFYIYKLKSTPGCSFGYCAESNVTCSGMQCASDEECKTVDGVDGCHCKNSSNTTNGIKPANVAEYIKPDVVCGLGTIEVRFSKCLLEELGYDTSSIHLKDNSCRGVTERRAKSDITLITRPAYGSCGGYTKNDGNEIIYSNTAYLASQSDGVIIRDLYAVDFHCSYPLNMEISLLTAISSYVASAIIDVKGTANFTITMGLFQDSGFTSVYTDSEVSLDSTSMLYVGVVVSGATSASQFVLILKNCYATPTADSASGPRYDIIKDRCPNKNDPTISVLENGVSLKGRFSLQIFRFLGGYGQIYLHCQIGLCDTSSYDCSAWCPSVRSAVDGIDSVKDIKLGPIKRKAAELSSPAALSSGGGTALPTTRLFISAVVFLLLLY